MYAEKYQNHKTEVKLKDSRNEIINNNNIIDIMQQFFSVCLVNVIIYLFSKRFRALNDTADFKLN